MFMLLLVSQKLFLFGTRMKWKYFFQVPCPGWFYQSFIKSHSIFNCCYYFDLNVLSLPGWILYKSLLSYILSFTFCILYYTILIFILYFNHVLYLILWWEERAPEGEDVDQLVTLGDLRSPLGYPTPPQGNNYFLWRANLFLDFLLFLFFDGCAQNY